MQAIKKSASFFNTVRQSIFYLKPNGFDSRKANDIPKMSVSEIGTCLTAIFRKERFVSGTIERYLRNNTIFMLLEHLKRGCR